LYVADAFAINAVPDVALRDGEMFNVLTQMVEDGELVFPNEVIAGLERLARDEQPHVWARAVAQSRRHKGATYAQVQWVMRQVGTLVDPDAEFESGGAFVVAQARELGQGGEDEVYVVTEDYMRKPTRMSLTEACDAVAIPHIRLRQCLTECGHGDLLT
jgi:hypothetical protein